MCTGSFFVRDGLKTTLRVLKSALNGEMLVQSEVDDTTWMGKVVLSDAVKNVIGWL